MLRKLEAFVVECPVLRLYNRGSCKVETSRWKVEVVF